MKPEHDEEVAPAKPVDKTTQVADKNISPGFFDPLFEVTSEAEMAGIAAQIELALSESDVRYHKKDGK